MDTTYYLNGGFKPTTKRNADLGGADFYPTPAWATYALMDNEKFDGDVWECACGDGAMTEVISEAGNQVYSSDLYDRGFGDAGIDFLSSNNRANNIVTNPPFHSAEGFVAAALEKADKKFALLLRLAFLEGARRTKTIFHVHPPSRVWVFSERITFYAKGAKRAGSGTTAYAWYVWDKEATGATELHWFKPGYKAKYS
ncbi:hypothetical protein KFF05_05275 [bacterium SCSIO 12827]|nr:hypothetical protein KFF05_05275 [bacterium SCSIO 12827]